MLDRFEMHVNALDTVPAYTIGEADKVLSAPAAGSLVVSSSWLRHAASIRKGANQ